MPFEIMLIRLVTIGSVGSMTIAEDPVCGSGHCHIIPYWADRLGREELVACQASRRGGMLYCRREGSKILMAGKAALFSVDELYV